MRNGRNKSLIEQAADYVEAAVEKSGPILADAKDKAGPALADARDKAAPLIAQGAAVATAKASQAADLASAKAAEAKDLAAQKADELDGQPKKKRHRVRKLLILTGIAALLAFVAKKLRDSADEENWQSSYTPPPAPGPAGAAEGGSDEGGAAPDEVLADAAEEAHDATTPDEPADVVDVAPGEEPVAKKSAKP